MLKRKIGWLTLLLSSLLIGSAFNFKLTGFTISSELTKISYLYPMLLGFILAGLALFLLESKTSIEVLFIPGSVNVDVSRRRAQKAAAALKDYNPQIIIASGGKTPGLPEEYQSEARLIYSELERAGATTRNTVRLEEKAQDSLDNLLYSLGGLERGKVGIVSNKGQINRLSYLIRKAQEEGMIGKAIEIIPITTEETFRDKIYEWISGLADKYLTRKGIAYRKSKPIS